MPTEERCRGHHEGDPAAARQDSARRRKQDPVEGPKLRSARGPLQHPELMAEDEDLEVLGSVVLARLSSTDEQTHEGPDDKVKERPHRPILPG